MMSVTMVRNRERTNRFLRTFSVTSTCAGSRKKRSVSDGATIQPSVEAGYASVTYHRAVSRMYAVCGAARNLQTSQNASTACLDPLSVTRCGPSPGKVATTHSPSCSAGSTRVLRGWCNYFGHGVSKATSNT